MAHEFESGLFVTEPAWHGLGVVLPNAPSVDEAITMAGLDWQVRPVPMYLASGTPVEGHRAMMRDSDGAQLGVVGSDFTPVQNSEAFNWIRPIIESGDATIEAAGALRGGRRVWILAKVKDGTVDVLRNDPIQSYVLFAHGHDGSLAVRAGFTTTRVVCQNTLSAAVNDGKQLLKFKHTAGVHDALAKARDAFDMQRAKLRSDAEVYRMLASKRLSDANLTRYIRETFQAGAGNDTTIKVRNVDTVVRLAHEGRGATPGTLWGGFNAITEYATHERGRTADSRVNSNWFGSGGDLVQRALATAVAYADKLPSADVGRECFANHASARLEMGALLSKRSAVLDQNP
jgi:phage/plasmid-like protein (TIGR03299 family)